MYTPSIINITPKPKSTGLKINHHDQSINPNIFAITNTIVNKPKNPTPPELFVLFIEIAIHPPIVVQ